MVRRGGRRKAGSGPDHVGRRVGRLDFRRLALPVSTAFPAPADLVASERAFEDHFYAHDLPALLRSPLFRAVDRRKVDFIRRRGLEPGARPQVLSLGVGDGRKEALLAPHVAGVVGVDLSGVAIDLARGRLARAGCGSVKLQCADVLTVELAPAGHDVVLAIGLLHHLDDARVDQLLARVWSWLKPGGVLITNDPQDRRLVALFRRCFLRVYRKYHGEGERELSIRRLVEQVGGAGFESPELHYTDFFLDPLGWVFPRFPGGLVGAACALDDLLLRVPGLRRFSSHFGLVARKPLQGGARAGV